MQANYSTILDLRAVICRVARRLDIRLILGQIKFAHHHIATKVNCFVASCSRQRLQRVFQQSVAQPRAHFRLKTTIDDAGRRTTTMAGMLWIVCCGPYFEIEVGNTDSKSLGELLPVLVPIMTATQITGKTSFECVSSCIATGHVEDNYVRTLS